MRAAHAMYLGVVSSVIRLVNVYLKYMTFWYKTICTPLLLYPFSCSNSNPINFRYVPCTQLFSTKPVLYKNIYYNIPSIT